MLFKPITPKGKQSWIFIRRTDSEAEAPKFWPPDVKNWLIGKDPDAGKAGGEGDDRRLDSWMASPLDGRELDYAPGVVMDRAAWYAAVHGVTVSHDWATELNWTSYVQTITSDESWTYNESKKYELPGKKESIFKNMG